MHRTKCIPNHPSSDCSHSVSYLILVREVVNVRVQSLSLCHLILTPEGAAAEHCCPPVSHSIPAITSEGGGSHIGPDIFCEIPFWQIHIVFCYNYLVTSPSIGIIEVTGASCVGHTRVSRADIR